MKIKIELDKFGIMRAVSDYYDISIEEIKSRDRHRPINDARQLIMYLLVMEGQMSYTKAGMCVNRNHATAIHAKNQIINRLTYDSKLNYDMDNIKYLIPGSRSKESNIDMTKNNQHLIDFAVYLTGHDRETIEQMYKDWKG